MAAPIPTTPRRKVLFLSNADRGEIGVTVATAQAIIETTTDTEVHIMTYQGVEELVRKVSSDSLRLCPGARPIVYHEIAARVTFDEVLELLVTRGSDVKPGYLPWSYLRKPTFRNVLVRMRDTLPIVVPLDGEKLETIVFAILDVIADVKPDLLVVNSFMLPGLTAAVHSKLPMVVLSPNSIKDFAGNLQPYKSALWRFPCVCTGLSYPIPWYQKPLNVFYTLHVVMLFLTDPHRKAAAAHMLNSNSRGVPIKMVTTPDFVSAQSSPSSSSSSSNADEKDKEERKRKPTPVLVASLLEVDFPLAYVPSHLHAMGPIIGRWEPIQKSDPEMLAWLSRGPTLYINPGSMVQVDECQALEMAAAVKSVLRKAKEPGNEAMSNLQVIWKLKKYGDYDTKSTKCAMYDILGPEMESGLIKIEKWLTPEPLSILQSGHVVCSVHHGGANSFNEALLCGLPQVVLPPWTDCYDYAHRAELHGIGKWGSKKSDPHWSAQELAASMSWCLFGKTAAGAREKAKSFAKLIRDKGNGAINAAEFIMQEMDERTSEMGTQS